MLFMDLMHQVSRALTTIAIIAAVIDINVIAATHPPFRAEAVGNLQMDAMLCVVALICWVATRPERPVSLAGAREGR